MTKNNVSLGRVLSDKSDAVFVGHQHVGFVETVDDGLRKICLETFKLASECKQFNCVRRGFRKGENRSEQHAMRNQAAIKNIRRTSRDRGCGTDDLCMDSRERACYPCRGNL